MQTNNPAVAKLVARLDTAELVGFSVTGPYLKLYALSHPADWVRENINAKLPSLFPRK